MDDRDVKIKSDLDNAQNNSADVHSMLEEAGHIIATAKSEAAAIREKARVEASEVAQKKLNEAKIKADEKYNQFVEILVSEKTSLEQSLLASMPQFKEALSSKLKTI
jgi:F-type H+-transporting ATPase subunit b